MKIKNLLLFFITILMSKCWIDTNTTDPQVSESIEESKQNNLFVLEFADSIKVDQLFYIDKVWIEHRWKYELDNGIRKIKKSDELQMILQISDYTNPFFKKDRFPIDWNIEESSNGYMGLSGGVYFLSLKDKEVADKYDFLVTRYKKDNGLDSISFSIRK